MMGPHKSPHIARQMRTWLLLSLLLAAPSACGHAEREREEAVAAAIEATAASTRAETLAEVEQALSAAVLRTDRIARRANRTLSPLPVMTPAEEGALRRFRNAAHVQRAREAGLRVEDEATLHSLVDAGQLMQLADSTQHWIVRPGTSPAYVVPEVPSLLGILGARFHERLSEMGLPAYRIEVTSALRTSQRQAELRATNRNAAAGVSSHEFGTTLDISYAAFAPPANLPPEATEGVPENLAPYISRLADLAFESVSGRKSRELGRIFSQVLREAQAEGLVLVIYERQQTVYHVTVGPALDG